MKERIIMVQCMLQCGKEKVRSSRCAKRQRSTVGARAKEFFLPIIGSKKAVY